jgi:hypothetical protein
MQLAIWARMVEEAGGFYPPEVIKTYEKGETFPSMVGDVHFRAEDHQLVRPVVIVRGKHPKDMKNNEDYWEVLEVVPGEGLMQKASRRLYLSRSLLLASRARPSLRRRLHRCLPSRLSAQNP